MKKLELSIPKPCHENWNAMTPQDKGRFCASCQKTVIDFSTMSDRQLAEFFKKPAGSVCGHFSNSQLNRVIDIPKKRMPWVRYFFTMALPAFLLSLKAGAQGEVRLRGRVAVKTQPEKQDTCVKPLENTEASTRLTGRVVDENGLPMQFVTVQVEKTNIATSTDSNGVFVLPFKGRDDKWLLMTHVGYESRKILVKDVKTKDVVMIPFVGTLDGEIVVTLGMVAPKKARTIPLFEPQKKDTAFSQFSVFPNPAAAFSIITIEPRKMEVGNYTVQIISGNGELLQAGEMVVERKMTRIPFALTQIPAGPYFIRLTNKKTNKSYTEIIIVQ